MRAVLRALFSVFRSPFPTSFLPRFSDIPYLKSVSVFCSLPPDPSLGYPLPFLLPSTPLQVFSFPPTIAFPHSLHPLRVHFADCFPPLLSALSGSICS